MKPLAILLTAVLLQPAFSQNSLEVQLQRAIQKEAGAGDLKGAIEDYKKIAARAGSNRAIAAQALLHLAEAYDKQGAAEARKTYEQIVKDFSDQREPAAQARQHLAAFGGGQGENVKLTQIRIPDDQNIQAWNFSWDGRFAGATNYLTGNAVIVDVAAGSTRAMSDYGNWNSEKGFVDQGVISRDGKQAAFWHYWSGAKGELTVYSTDGKPERSLYQSKNLEDGGEWGIPTDWSPDGKWIAMQLEKHTKPGDAFNGATDFLLIPSSGGAPRVIKSAEFQGRFRPQILFSPDSKYVAYTYYPNPPSQSPTDVFVVPVEGGAATAIAASAANETLAGWAPDGSILVLSDRSSESKLYRVGMRNGKQSGDPEIVRPGLSGTPVSITRSGALIFTQGSSQLNSYVASIDLNSGKLLTPAKVVSQAYPDANQLASWSPDGQQIVFQRKPPAAGPPALVFRGNDGREREMHPALSSLSANHPLKWSPDGRSLLVFGTLKDKRGVFRVNVNSGEATLIAEVSDVVDWTSDGRWIFRRMEGPALLLRRDTASGQEKEVHRRPEASGISYRLSPDGSKVAFMQAGRPPFIGVFPSDGGPVTTLYTAKDRESLAMNGVAWSPDGREVLFVKEVNVKERNETHELWAVPSTGGAARKTDLTFNGDVWLINMHPDGKQIAYTLKRSKTEMWMMENFLPASK